MINRYTFPVFYGAIVIQLITESWFSPIWFSYVVIGLCGMAYEYYTTNSNIKKELDNIDLKMASAQTNEELDFLIAKKEALKENL